MAVCKIIRKSNREFSGVFIEKSLFLKWSGCTKSLCEYMSFMRLKNLLHYSLVPV